MFVSVVFFIHCWRFFWVLVWLIFFFFNWSLDILLSLWILFQSSVSADFFLTLIWQGKRQYLLTITRCGYKSSFPTWLSLTSGGVLFIIAGWGVEFQIPTKAPVISAWLGEVGIPCYWSSHGLHWHLLGMEECFVTTKQWWKFWLSTRLPLTPPTWL